MSKLKIENERSIRDQLRIQFVANKRATKQIDCLKKEIEVANKEILEVHDRVNFWIDYAIWMRNTYFNPSQKRPTKNGLLQSMVDQLSEKERGVFSSIILTILSKGESLESILDRMIENKSPSINKEYNISEDQSLKLNMNRKPNMKIMN